MIINVETANWFADFMHLSHNFKLFLGMYVRKFETLLFRNFSQKKELEWNVPLVLDPPPPYENPRYATGLQGKVENSRCLGFDCSLKVRNSNFKYGPSVVD